ncbi:MAG: Adenylate kinase [Candidatus Collierbacteria bacterium GW2011_GWB1_44_6]|uniref:Adenylate kinase n=2 Tax=Candidatus Collieribacteriota TaxID=1752725 RepID=A0A0G1JNW4_9BACT|nr:MAG: Adenylate kinase [Candidatus Collierbacteria bacterium GW2011_GWC2_43_12]KKT73038.1 MAG: Adenylate kinase [Candidatus Collierbacteria bacterium GW2011_GWB1_44_6]KKT82841.1 MAG: adenylate kinase, adenylate kinase [Microgenomates group bacterium GW2011_GWC1_44_9]
MNLIILGPQGSGKGTQAKLIAEKFGMIHVSSGDLLREAAKQDTDKGRLLADLLTTGQLIPFDTVLEVTEPVLLSAKNGFILDGTPRDLMQAEYLDWYLGERNIKIDKVIFLNIPRDISLARLASRAKIENRTDDTPEGIHARLDIFDNETLPVIDYFRKQGKVVDIDGTPEPQIIFADIVNKLGLI